MFRYFFCIFVYFVSHIEAVNQSQNIMLKPYHYQVEPPVEPFIGRANEFNSIKWLLLNRRFVAIIGRGGVGKTELARKYILYYQKQYGICNIIWINSESTTTMARDFRNIAFKQGVHMSKITDVIESLFRYFRNLTTLFIFDNAQHNNILDRVYTHMKENQDVIHVIMTSRKYDIIGDDFSVITLSKFTFPEARELIFIELRHLGIPLTDSDIKNLSETVNYSPKILMQSLCYIKEQNRKPGSYFTIENFINAIVQNKTPFLEAEIIENEAETLAEKFIAKNPVNHYKPSN